ncbi:MAG: hypothetical protein FWC69_03375, partial [Defluviitaleaceae bacterium]|nr:hypothetical protein [Defluviitaleaceae bacterium]
QRYEIEKTVKEHQIDRNHFFEVSKQSYQQIIKKIEAKFIQKSKHSDGIHWANLGRYRSELKCTFIAMKDWNSWMKELPDIIPVSDTFVYALFEKVGYNKYWLYEAQIQELITVLNESTLWGDFYIVSKKYDWLISLDHHDCISYVGENLVLDSTTA